jgi:SlyX protein
MEKRIIELEIKLAHQDDLVRALDDVVARLQKQVDGLAKEIRFLQLREGEEPLPDEPPPHY